jgi:hypothetical protein
MFWDMADGRQAQHLPLKLEAIQTLVITTICIWPQDLSTLSLTVNGKLALPLQLKPEETQTQVITTTGTWLLVLLMLLLTENGKPEIKPLSLKVIQTPVTTMTGIWLQVLSTLWPTENGRLVTKPLSIKRWLTTSWVKENFPTKTFCSTSTTNEISDGNTAKNFEERSESAL